MKSPCSKSRVETEAMGFIALGTITRPFGVRGEVRLRPYNPYTAWFEKAGGVWLRPHPEAEPRYYRVLRSRRHKDFILLALEGIRDRNQAEELRGWEAVVPEEELLPELEEGEYYWFQLVGLEAETIGGKRLGRVVRMEETAPRLGGNDVFVIQGEEGELMIPATEEMVKKVNLEEGKLIFCELEPRDFTA